MKNRQDLRPVLWGAVLSTPLALLLMIGHGLALVLYLPLGILACRWLVEEIREMELAVDAVERERRRIARNLHDSLAQELNFLVARSRRLIDRSTNDRDAELIAEAAERALIESRSAISRLRGPQNMSLDEILERELTDVAEREGVELLLSLQPVDAPDDIDDGLSRIAREALVNAARHGRARSVSVELTNGRGIRLSVRDDGVGFDETRELSGFGIVGMRERAQDLGGDLRIHSSPGGGTEVDVVVVN